MVPLEASSGELHDLYDAGVLDLEVLQGHVLSDHVVRRALHRLFDRLVVLCLHRYAAGHFAIQAPGSNFFAVLFFVHLLPCDSLQVTTDNTYA